MYRAVSGAMGIAMAVDVSNYDFAGSEEGWH
jgi:hypothetical protein